MKNKESRSPLMGLPQNFYFHSDGKAFDKYAKMMGNYRKLPRYFNNAPVYKHQDKSHFLFVDKDDNWVIGGNGVGAYLFSGRDEKSELPDMAGWHFLTKEGKWKRDPLLSLKENPVTTVRTSTTTTTTTTTTTPPVQWEKIFLTLKALSSQDSKPIDKATATVTLNKEGKATVVADKFPFENGIAKIPVKENGEYQVKVEAPKFVPREYTAEVGCETTECKPSAMEPMSPALPPGETRIMFSWKKEGPKDMDIHVYAIPRSGGDKSGLKNCHVKFSNKNCPTAHLDNDNTRGGDKGSETVTIKNHKDTSKFTYIIAAEDYNCEDRKDSKWCTRVHKGKAKITITNVGETGVGDTIDVVMKADEKVHMQKEFYFYGCLTIDKDAHFTFKAPSKPIWFKDHMKELEKLKRKHC